MKLSIIVPVYNAEEFIKKCVDSILDQTFKDFELILVDDGSKDSSSNICDEYAQKDSRVKVIHKENAGVSSARNSGIELAQGEYLGFVDSDDWIDNNMFESLINEAEKNNTDIVMCDASTVYSNGREEKDTITKLAKSSVINKVGFTSELLMEMAGAAWRCIYKSSLIKENKIVFPQGIKLSEDRIFNIYAMGLSNNISYIKKSYYNRLVNTKSAVHRFHEDYFEICKKAAKATRKAIELAWDNSQEYQTAYLCQFISGAIMSVNNYYYKTSTLTGKEKIEKVKEICNDEMLIDAIERYGIKSRQIKWIKDKNIIMIIAYAKLSNLKHGR